MAGFSMYLAERDAEPLHRWINAEPTVWLVCESGNDNHYRWRAFDKLDSFTPGRYCLWHPQSYPLFIPSGQIDVDDILIANPFSGWSERTEYQEESPIPWFGSGHSGTYIIDYRVQGSENKGSIARSSVSWIGDHFRVIGKPAHPIGKKWYDRLLRFVKKEAVGVPWPPDVAQLGVAKNGAYAFPHAYTRFIAGAPLDTNTTWGPYT